MANGSRVMVAVVREVRDIFFTTPVYSLTLMGKIPTGLLIKPHDLWPGNSKSGAEILKGTYNFSGQSVSISGSPWLYENVSRMWLEDLHAFSWLRSLRAENSDEARRLARKLISDWINKFDSKLSERVAWMPEIIADRIANWLCQYEFFGASADDGFQRMVLNSLSRQLKHLNRVIPKNAHGFRNLRIVRGITYGSICISGSTKQLARSFEILKRELPRQAFPDGGYADRNPSSQLMVLQYLLEIRSLLRTAKVGIPEQLQMAIDRMTPMLRFFRHGDGALALFNGSNEGEASMIEAVINQADSRGRPLKSAPHSGFERILIGRSLVIMDVGKPPPRGFDKAAHAGTLAFELSSGKDRIVVNCGSYSGAVGEWRAAFAATAAHSTLTVDNKNSSGIIETGGMERRPQNVQCTRTEENGNVLVDANHDGYLKTHGIVHRRRLYVSSTGDDVRGEDILEGDLKSNFAIRFHLHPNARVSLTQDGMGALLRFTGGQGWRFRASNLLKIEDSIYLGSRGPQKSCQIVIECTAVDGKQVKWAFHRESN